MSWSHREPPNPKSCVQKQGQRDGPLSHDPGAPLALKLPVPVPLPAPAPNTLKKVLSTANTESP